MCSSDAAQLHSWRCLQRRSTISGRHSYNAMLVAGMLRCMLLYHRQDLLLVSIATCGLPTCIVAT